MINVLQCSLLAFVCLLATSHGQKVNVTMSNSIAEHILDLALRLGNNLNFTESATISPVTIVSSIGSQVVNHNNFSELIELFEQPDVEKFFFQLRLMLNDAQKVDPNKISPLRKRDRWQKNIGSIHREANEVKFQNTFFVDLKYQLSKKYFNLLKDYFGTLVVYLDFQKPDLAKKLIQNWLLDVTETKFNNESKFDSIRALVVNTFRFNASFDSSLISSSSRLDNFYPNGLDGDPVLVQMAILNGILPSYEDKKLGVRILGIPYSSRMNTLYIIQPLDSNKNRLEALQSKLSGKLIEHLIKKLENRRTEVTLPYLDLNNSFDLTDALLAAGLTSAFGETEIETVIPREYFEDSLTDLAQMLINGFAKTYTLSFDAMDLQHYVTVTISENKTSAKSVNQIHEKSGPDVHFNVNTPFLLLIRNDLTRLPLVYSIINKPKAQ